MAAGVPVLMNKSLLAAKIETTVGTAITLATADTAFNVYDLKCDPEIEMLARSGQAGFAKLASVVGRKSAKISFKNDCKIGTSAPTWMTTFLPACGLVKGAGTVYTPISSPPSVGGVKTITIGWYIDGLLHTIRGCAGNVVFEANSGGPVIASFDFTGVYAGISAASILTQTFPTTNVPARFASNAVTFNANSMQAASFKVDLGNNVYLREDSTTAEGFFAACISDRRTIITTDMESTAALTPTYYGYLTAGTRGALAITCPGTGSGSLIFAAPKAQLEKQPMTDRSGIMTEQLEFLATPDALVDDDFTLTYALDT
jgi:hypothetical protein